MRASHFWSRKVDLNAVMWVLSVCSNTKACITLIQIMPIYHFHMAWSALSRVKISFSKHFQYIRQTLNACGGLVLSMRWVTSLLQPNGICSQIVGECSGYFFFLAMMIIWKMSLYLLGWRCKIRPERTKCNLMSRPNDRATASGVRIARLLYLPCEMVVLLFNAKRNKQFCYLIKWHGMTTATVTGFTNSSSTSSERTNAHLV